jgi:hypothetical protein
MFQPINQCRFDIRRNLHPTQFGISNAAYQRLRRRIIVLLIGQQANELIGWQIVLVHGDNLHIKAFQRLSTSALQQEKHLTKRERANKRVSISHGSATVVSMLTSFFYSALST